MGQLQTFTQYNEDGKPSTIRLYTKKPLEIEAESIDALPNDIKLAIKARYVFVREIKNEENPVKVMGAFPNNEGGKN